MSMGTQERWIVVTPSHGVPFDFCATHDKIEMNGAQGKAAAWTSDTEKQVSVRFVPYRSGDTARKVVIGG